MAYSNAPSCAKYYKNNKEKVQAKQKEWRKGNLESIKKIQKKWRDSNKDLTRFYCLMRRKRIKQATPKWCDREQMFILVKRAQELGLELDHIIPLKHPLVCGLHVPENIQLLSMQENRSKNNKFDIIGLL